MRLSARNQIKGKILEVKKGATTSHVRVEIGPGQIITSSITNEAVDELGLKAGAAATGVRRDDRGGLTAGAPGESERPLGQCFFSVLATL
jgi:molybdopterin-binding protein